MLSCWFQLHLQPLTTTNPYWARVEGYGPFALCVIHKEGLCPSSGDINRLMMKIKISKITFSYTRKRAFYCHAVLLTHADLARMHSTRKESFHM
jgi:hypothetical protein